VRAIRVPRASRGSDPGAGEAQVLRFLGGTVLNFFFSRALVVAAPVSGAALPFQAADPFPIPGVLARQSGSDRGPIGCPTPAPILPPIADRGVCLFRCSGGDVHALPEGGFRVEVFCAAYGIGFTHDTSPQNGCCTATVGRCARTC
jgi:hypothetical protein